MVFVNAQTVTESYSVYEELLQFLREIARIDYSLSTGEKDFFEYTLVRKIVNFEHWLFWNFPIEKFYRIRRVLDEMLRFPVSKAFFNWYKISMKVWDMTSDVRENILLLGDEIFYILYLL